MEVTNVEIIERGCCCFLEIKLISTWTVTKNICQKILGLFILYTLYPDFFPDWDPIVFITIKLTTIRETIFGTFFFFHPSIVDLRSANFSRNFPWRFCVANLKLARFPCGFGVEIHPRRVEFSVHSCSTGSSFQNATTDDRRRSMKWRFQMVLLLQRLFFFFRNLAHAPVQTASVANPLPQMHAYNLQNTAGASWNDQSGWNCSNFYEGSLYKVYPFLVGGNQTITMQIFGNLQGFPLKVHCLSW